MDKSLENIKEKVNKLFEKATEKADVDALAEINKAIEQADNDNTALLNKNKELMNAYKEAVLHTSFKEPDPNTSRATDEGGQKSFEDMLAGVIKNRKKN